MIKKIFFILILIIGFTYSRNYSEILKSKKLIVITRIKENIFTPKNEKKGFMYDIIKSYADFSSLKLEVKTVSNISVYFNKKDILKDADIIVDNLTILPEREKYFAFIKILPIKQIIITAGNNKIRAYRELDGKTAVITKDTSYEINLNNIIKAKKFNIKYYYSSKTENQIPDLISGKGYFTVLDSNIAVMVAGSSKINLNRTISKTQYIGWAVNKSNKELISNLDNYINNLKKTEKFNTLWSKYVKIMNYEKYLKVINR